ncbi:MAG: hypothetical protein V4612_06195 [Pseudomonadota bacterium]
MYKIFHNNIKHFSLIIGYLNLLRSFYYSSAEGNTEDKSYIIADKMIERFKNFCKKTIKEIEKLIEDPSLTTSLNTKDLKEIVKLMNSLAKPASQGLIQEIGDSILQIEKFIDFLLNDFPEKTINQVDLRAIKTTVKVFKYQIYLC